MKMFPVVTAFLTLSALFAPVARPTDELCVVYPMFPYSGSDWYHYAVHYQKNGAQCNFQNTVAWIGTYTPSPQNCPGGTCLHLGDNDFPKATEVINSDLFLRRALKNYEDLNDAAEVKALLQSEAAENLQIPVTAKLLDQIDALVLEPAPGHPNNGRLPPVVAFMANDQGIGAPVYAALWKVKLPIGDATDWAYIGFQIAPSDVHILNPAGVHRSTVQAYNASAELGGSRDDKLMQDLVVHGVVELQLAPDDEDLYFIRLKKNPLTMSDTAFPRRKLAPNP